MSRIRSIARPLTFAAASFGLACAVGFATAQPTPPAHPVAYLAPAITAAAPLKPVHATAAADRKAFTRYVNKPTYPRLVTLVETTLALRTDTSLYSHLRILRADVLQLAADVEGGAGPYTVQTDEQYAGEDLYGGA